MNADLLHILSEAYDKACPYMPMPDYIHECRAYGEILRCGYDCAEDGNEYEADIEIADIDSDDPDAIKEAVVSRACDSLLAKYGPRIALPTEDSAIWFDGPRASKTPRPASRSPPLPARASRLTEPNRQLGAIGWLIYRIAYRSSPRHRYSCRLACRLTNRHDMPHQIGWRDERRGEERDDRSDEMDG